MTQVIVVILTITLAVGYLAKLFYGKFLKKQPHCDGCAFSKGKSPISYE